MSRADRDSQVPFEIFCFVEMIDSHNYLDHCYRGLRNTFADAGPARYPMHGENVPVGRGHLVHFDVESLAADHFWLQEPAPNLSHHCAGHPM